MSKLVTKSVLEELARGLHSKAKEYTDNTVQGLDVTTLEGRVDALELKDTQLAAKDVELESKITTNTSTIANIKTEIGVKGNGADIAATGIYKFIANADATALQEAKTYAEQKVAELVDSAPDNLNTLKELADKIKENKDIYDAYVTTVNGKLDTKVDKVVGSRLITDVEAAEYAAKADAADVAQALQNAKTYTDQQIAAIDTTAITDRLDDLEAKDVELESKITANKTAITTLNGADSVTGSVAHSIKQALAPYSKATDVKGFISNNVQTLAFTQDLNNITLTLGGADGVSTKTTQLPLTTSAEITALLKTL